ncbi:Thioredoxin reductase [Actinokineospora alba]|uniref:Thioredoxin reductase n=1 Tax=Actinokineospora alba TaxID=504798 RepID=A0A1H0ERB9_9PSEU|nr:FAD-dependent oxidoreductase [Actinokineospora alba]TDP69194.1 thioredoxin reductase [Actinokineospora alba]SDI22141.1 Thioredoxin reductase [Actinokineospora alba]SDN84928.1 Thioredoxin reductase [Actinokineospora alba]
MTRRVVVVGAGPAGINAALAAADAGAEVTLVDSAPTVGGQFHRQPAGAGPDKVPGGTRLVEHPNVRLLADTVVWAIEPLSDGHRVHVRTGQADGPGRRGETLTADALVLATGAYDRALPFPGWDLPGVVTAGAAQALAKGQGVAIGKRVVVAGTGPFLLPVAQSLTAVGAQVVEVLEANGGLRGWTPSALFAGRGKLAELAGYARLLATHRIPYRTRRTVIAAHGEDRVTEVTTAALDREWGIRPGTERRVPVDAVCVGFGFTPQLELAVSARCRLIDGFVEVTPSQETSVPGVFAAGELTGIGGADLAAAEGAIAGAAAAGRPIPEAALRKARRGRTFAAGLADAYPVPPGWRTWPADDTLVCRCEEVTLAALRTAARERAALGVRSLKLTSRVGLGLCQGRVCGRNAAELAAGFTGGHYDPADTARRPIAAPLRLGELAEDPDKEKT